MTAREMTYDEFVRQLEARSPDVSPLMFIATMANRPAEASAWALQWLHDNKPGPAGVRP